MWQKSPYIIPLIGASAFSVMMMLYIVLRRRIPGSRIGVLLILATTEWMVMYALELASVDFSAKIFWNKMQYPGIVTAPTAWFVFSLVCTGHERWLTRRTRAVLPVIPVVTVLLAFTNEYHGFIWSDLVLSTEGPIPALINIHGPWFWVNAFYAYALVLWGALLFLFQMFICSRSLYRWQISALLSGALFPWGANVLFLFGANPFPYLDLTPFGFVFTNMAVAFSIIYFQLGDMIPIARETIIECLSDCVIVLDEENRILDMNPLAQRLMSNATTFIGEPIEKVWPVWGSQMEPKKVSGKEIVLGHGDEQFIYDVSISPLTDWRGRTVSRVVVLRDITERKRAEDKIRQSLKEKEVLLKEIHHRVKNNMQIISSLLSLQSHYSTDKPYRDMFKESQDRIKSMALIHEKLYQSENLAEINFKEYIKTLVHGLIRSYRANTGSVSVTLDVKDTFLDIGTAIPCGLIINELVSNSLKHAFPHGNGELTVILHTINNIITLIVKDNGVGIPDTIDFKHTQSLGLHLVTILTEDQLEGEITLDRTKGTTFCITFNKKRRNP